MLQSIYVRLDTINSKHLSEVETHLIALEQRARELQGKEALTNFHFKAELWVMPNYVEYKLIEGQSEN